MSSLFTSLTYPHHEAAATEFHRQLVEIFYTPDEALSVAKRAGIPPYQLNIAKPVFFLWQDILEYASSKGLIKTILDVVLGILSPNHPSYPFFKALQEEKSPPIKAEPERNNDGSVPFVETSSTFTEEALLFYDDLSLEIGRLPALLTSLEHLRVLAPSICHLLINFNGLIKHGTGFRIAENLLLTNWHVVYDKDGVPASSITAEFGHEDDGNGGFLDSKKVACKTDNIVASKEDDWAAITVNGNLDAAWPLIKLSAAAEPELHQPAYIIQHPQGQSKRLAYVRNQVADFTDRTIHYFTDTQEGSSGSPVFNAAGKLIALHRAGGLPQKIPGRPPVKKNEGIRISRIITGLQQQQIQVP